MLAIPGIIALVVLIYARPQEFYVTLQTVPWLYLCFGIALYGAVLDLRLRNVRLASTPQLLWVVLFFVYAAVIGFVRSPNEAFGHVRELAICVALFLLIAHGVQSFRRLHLVAGTVLAMVILVCAVGTHQGFAETGCIQVDESIAGDYTDGQFDGRPCTTPRECYLGDPEPGAQYLCEHVGLLGTTSVGKGRVRYRGVLQDPNELALAGGIGLPLAFALGRVPRRSLRRGALVAGTLALVIACAVLTRSRMGQLVIVSVLATYFVQRFGLKGAAVGGTMALPLLLLGGRSGDEASSSTVERLDCWVEALSLFRMEPFFGIGLGQFGDYHYKTAHNSYLLTLAELGPLGMLLFSILLYVSIKIPLAVLRHVPASDATASGAAVVARPWAMALVAAFVGLTLGLFFLSFAYHYVLWIYVGLAGALYSAVRAHDPTFRVRLGLRDFGLVVALDVAIIATIYLYTRWALA